MYYLHATAFYHFWAGKKYKTRVGWLLGLFYFCFKSFFVSGLWFLLLGWHVECYIIGIPLLISTF